MDNPGREGATKQHMIDCYIQTLAKVVRSEAEANKRIYNVSCESYFGFGGDIDEETSNKLEGLPDVLFVLPDSYIDPENEDDGGRSCRDHLKDREGWSRSRRDTRIDQDTMIEIGMSGVGKIGVEGAILYINRILGSF
ncbi:multiple organellar RNA editing factor 2, chloroplastic-like [Neltuma alba]|uniref:multiple organellar RNA editing factor 2, chloroplastic-like n=1 Tax=Neltuma alba TaxID=207710 RepID=UPI0010A3E147|nr:multiple organellar RNA editing factor 2, chloroplastic-like isoform X1 [Prosopis alba]XP_028805029.1 multiple organellar RNA editing factor 2, chloroplastic-like [Prosopis alba]